MSRQFLEMLGRQVIIGDGAMGTMLYQNGIFLNTCFDELNLTNPSLVEKIHLSYIEASADFIETNSFGANELKLGKFGLGDKVEQVNQAAVEIAQRAVAQSGVMIAGSVGPLGGQLRPFGSLEPQVAQQIFARQIKSLHGIDFLILETFTNPDELLVALDAAQSVTSLPIVAQITTNEHQETIYGQRIDDAIRPIANHPAVSVIGLNCAIGPSDMLNSLELIQKVTDKPISIQPNAGLPREVEGRMIYMSTPEYMAEYGKRFFEKGVKIIGGCCGTTPRHIQELVKAVRALDRALVTQRPVVHLTTREAASPKGQPEMTLAEKSSFGRKLATGEKVTSVEITPPRGANLDVILQKALYCKEHGIDAINIPDGPRASSRVSPMITAVRILQETGLEAILHVCCRDRNIIGIQSDILGVEAIGLRNVLIITGDPPKLGDYPDATAVFDLDAIGLTRVVKNLNQGIDIGNNTFSPPLSLILGVGANPVATDIDREVERFSQKVRAGAEYAITQPIFDADMLLRFLDKIEPFRIPIVAGIWPFASYKNAEFMANEVPGVVVPNSILERMSKAKTREDGQKMGIEIARELVRAIEDKVEGFAVSAPFGKVETSLAVLNKL
ncbi:MAG: bifunctional homocysteine S-methyltransferase/methylenetetrahydrofolate reductase [Phycisphaerae bacterium]|nr:bifunctional homocysteine S-methyltransferase/methylenetetrahydrofolate reductase [Phycisphaerae bacterium]